MSGNHEVFDADQFSAMLSEAVQYVKTEEDPILLNEYKKLFKKHVPLTIRTWVAAYFAKAAFNGNDALFGQNGRNRSGRHGNSPVGKNRAASASRGTEKKVQSEESRKPRHVKIDESLASFLYINIGRSRHVYTRDFLHLISLVGGIDRERIGEIRIFENYSFVQLFSEDCEKVIEALNGYEYRGRALSVSYSKKKDGAEDAAAESDFSADASDGNNIAAKAEQTADECGAAVN